jgi:hypothetical protein
VHLERGEIEQAIALLSDNVAFCRRKSLVLEEVDGLVALGRAEAARDVGPSRGAINKTPSNGAALTTTRPARRSPRPPCARSTTRTARLGKSVRGRALEGRGNRIRPGRAALALLPGACGASPRRARGRARQLERDAEGAGRAAARPASLGSPAGLQCHRDDSRGRVRRSPGRTWRRADPAGGGKCARSRRATARGVVPVARRARRSRGSGSARASSPRCLQGRGRALRDRPARRARPRSSAATSRPAPHGAGADDRRAAGEPRGRGGADPACQPALRVAQSARAARASRRAGGPAGRRQRSSCTTRSASGAASCGW